MKRFLLAMIAVLTVSSAAHAGIMIEPFFGYAVSGKEKAGSVSTDVKGMEFGARLGFTFAEMFAIGAEYAKGAYTVKTSPNVDVSSTDLGAFVSVEFPILIRAYATYFVDSKAKPDGGVESTGDGGYRIGIGYTGLPFVSINLEMVHRTYDKPTSFDVDTTEIGLSLPLP